MKHPYETKTLIIPSDPVKVLGGVCENPVVVDLAEVVEFEKEHFMNEARTPAVFILMRGGGHCTIACEFNEFKKIMTDKGLLKFE